MVTCHVSVGETLAGSGTRAMPSPGRPAAHAFRNGVRSTVNAAFLASYCAGTEDLQSVLGAGADEPAAPSVNGCVTAQASSVAVSAEAVPSVLAVSTGIVMAPPVAVAPM